VAVRQTIELRVGGHTYRVVSGGAPEEARRLAAIVDERIARVVPKGKTMTPEQAMLLAALSLAHDLVELEGAATSMSAELRQSLTRVLTRVDEVLGDGALEQAAGVGASPAHADEAPRPSTPALAPAPAPAPAPGLAPALGPRAAPSARPAAAPAAPARDLFLPRDTRAPEAPRRVGSIPPSGPDDET
jgi:cell division protein ZapA